MNPQNGCQNRKIKSGITSFMQEIFYILVSNKLKEIHMKPEDIARLVLDYLKTILWPGIIITLIILFDIELKGILSSISKLIDGLKHIKIGGFEGSTVAPRDENSSKSIERKKKDGKAIKNQENEPLENLENTEKQELEKVEISFNKKIKDPTIRKILKTLWTYQINYYPETFNNYMEDRRRWTFTLKIQNPEYHIFIKKMKILANEQYIAQDINTLQYYLTDFGIWYCTLNEELLGNELYEFN